MGSGTKADAFAAYERDGFPMGRLGHPEEVAMSSSFWRRVGPTGLTAATSPWMGWSSRFRSVA